MSDDRITPLIHINNERKLYRITSLINAHTHTHTTHALTFVEKNSTRFGVHVSVHSHYTMAINKNST